MIVGSEIVKNFLDEALETFKESNNADIQTNPKLFEVVANAYRNKVPVSYISQILSLLSQGITEFTWEVFNSNYDGTAYSTVTGQNANNSVRVTKEFLESVERDEETKLTYRTDPNKFTKVKAKKIWDGICRAAWSCGDPGLQYDTNINDWHTCPNSGRINASNPCSEYMFLDNTACNLASLNLVAFENEDGSFDKESFVHVVRLWTFVLEISVYMAQYPSKEIAKLSHEFRTLGLGYCNLGTLLMRAGMPYDSEQGRAYAAYITCIMHGAACEAVTELAKVLGTFDGFEKNREAMLTVMKNHRRVVTGEKCQNVGVQPVPLNKKFIPASDIEYALTIWNRVISNGEKYGFRNAQVTLLAPTGTIGIAMGAGTGGMEPLYSLYFFKQLAGGGYMLMVDSSTPIILKRLGYSDFEIQDILEYMIGTRSLDKCHIINREELIKRGLNDEEVNLLNKALPSTDSIESVFSRWTLGEAVFKRLNIPESDLNLSFSLLNFLRFTKQQIADSDLTICGRLTIEGAPHLKLEHLPIFDCANKSGHGERYIRPEGHILMMEALQPFLSGAISKTVNTPENATIEDFSKLMFFGKDHLIKAISVFRDRSKQSSAISSKTTQALEASLKKAIPSKSFISERAKREVLPSQRRGYTQRVTIGGSQNIFYHTTGENKEGDIREIFISGGDHQGPAFKELMHCFAKLFSISLQHGTPVEVLINSFTYVDFPPNGVVSGDPNIRFAKSWIDYIMRQIGIHYRDMKHLGHSSVTSKNEKESESRYTGEICQNPKCRSIRMRREGTCSYCEDCFSSTGCG
jgi:ribonucleoside-diphosphate reductase alpha chain